MVSSFSPRVYFSFKEMFTCGPAGAYKNLSLQTLWDQTRIPFRHFQILKFGKILITPLHP